MNIIRYNAVQEIKFNLWMLNNDVIKLGGLVLIVIVGIYSFKLMQKSL